MSLPPLIPWLEVHTRLPKIFPEGTPNRAYLVREATAKTIFVALYIGAIAGADRWLAPRHVVHMSDTLATQQNDDTRNLVYHLHGGAKLPRGHADKRWYADNTR